MKLSILICTVPGREEKLSRVLSILEPHAVDRPVEVLVLRDNRRRSIGEKRNALMKMARGEFVSFVDDDDELSPLYVEKILDALEPDKENGVPHLVTFEVWVTGYEGMGYHPRTTRFSTRYDREDNLDGEFRRYPNHIMVWRKEIADQFPFDDISFGEDGRRAERMRSYITDDRKIVNIEEVLYWYRLDPRDSATMRGGSLANPRRLARQQRRGHR